MHAGVGGLVEPLEQCSEGGSRIAGREGDRGIEVDPGAAREVSFGHVAVQEGVTAPRDDSRGHVEKALASQRAGQEFAAVNSSAVELAFADGEPSKALDSSRGIELELDLRAVIVEASDSLRQDGVAPHGDSSDAKGSASPRADGAEGFVRSLELAQDSPGMGGCGGAERGETRPVGGTLEEPGAKLVLDAGDDPAEGWLGQSEALGGPGNAVRLGDGEESDEVPSLIEHCGVPRDGGGRPHVSCY